MGPLTEVGATKTAVQTLTVVQTQTVESLETTGRPEMVRLLL